jgi:2-hydroxy-6-oxonona-2,4-dienedioate hydrolase
VPHRVLFLPGASGAGAFWRPVADLLPSEWETVLLDWPGLGDVPRDPKVNSLDDLVDLVLAQIGDQAVDLVAQSMGGVVAMRVALARPDLVRSLVLVATSGGVDLSIFDLEDWRPAYRAEYPNALPFITELHQEDVSDRLATMHAPALLLWATGDGISPPPVGEHLASKLPNAQLQVLEYTDHMFARDHAAEVAPLIIEHLSDSAVALRL